MAETNTQSIPHSKYNYLDYAFFMYGVELDQPTTDATVKKITELNLLDSDNIYKNVEFFENVDVRTFIKPVDITTSVIQALSFIDFSQPVEEIIKRVTASPILSKVTNTETLKGLLESYKPILDFKLEELKKQDPESFKNTNVVDYQKAYDTLTSLKLPKANPELIWVENVKSYLLEEPKKKEETTATKIEKKEDKGFFGSVFESLGLDSVVKKAEGVYSEVASVISNPMDNVTKLASSLGVGENITKQASSLGVGENITKQASSLIATASGEKSSGSIASDVVGALSSVGIGGDVSKTISQAENLTSIVSNPGGIAGTVQNIIGVGGFENPISGVQKAMKGSDLIPTQLSSVLNGAMGNKIESPNPAKIVESLKSQDMVSGLMGTLSGDTMKGTVEKAIAGNSLIGELTKEVGSIETLKSQVSSLTESVTMLTEATKGKVGDTMKSVSGDSFKAQDLTSNTDLAQNIPTEVPSAVKDIVQEVGSVSSIMELPFFNKIGVR